MSIRYQPLSWAMKAGVGDLIPGPQWCRGGVNLWRVIYNLFWCYKTAVVDRAMNHYTVL